MIFLYIFFLLCTKYFIHYGRVLFHNWTFYCASFIFLVHLRTCEWNDNVVPTDSTYRSGMQVQTMYWEPFLKTLVLFFLLLAQPQQTYYDLQTTMPFLLGSAPLVKLPDNVETSIFSFLSLLLCVKYKTFSLAQLHTQEVAFRLLYDAYTHTELIQSFYGMIHKQYFWVYIVYTGRINIILS